MGPKLLKCCSREQVGTKEHGKMLKRIQILEYGRVPAKEATDSKTEGKKRRITRKEYRRQLNEFELEGSMAQKKILLEREKGLQDRDALPRKEGDPKVMLRRINFLSSLLREDLVEKDERRKQVYVREREREKKERKKEREQGTERRRKKRARR